MNKLKELRLQHEKTQKDLADFLNVTPKAISFYELGQRDIPNDALIKLADFFHITTDELLGREKFALLLGNDENSAMMKYIKENNLDGTIKSFLRLSPEVREQAQSYIDYLVKKDAEARVKKDYGKSTTA